MEEVLENAVPQASTDFRGSQKHDVANQTGAEGTDRLALTASQETSDERKGGNDASAAQVGSSL